MQISTLTFQEYSASCSATSHHASDERDQSDHETESNQGRGKLYEMNEQYLPPTHAEEFSKIQHEDLDFGKKNRDLLTER